MAVRVDPSELRQSTVVHIPELSILLSVENFFFSVGLSGKVRLEKHLS